MSELPVPPRRRPSTRSAALIAFTGILLAQAQIRAHDIPNAQVDRSVQVTVTPGRVQVDYEVSLAELTLVQDLRNLIGTIPRGSREALFARYATETGPLNARGILATFDGRPLEFRVRSYDLVVEEHPRFTFHLEAVIGSRGRLSLRDTNYVESAGTSRLAVRAAGGAAISGYEGPEDVEDVPIKPVWQMTEQEERRTKQVDIDVGTSGSTGSGSTPAAMPRKARAAGARPVEPGVRVENQREQPASSKLAGLLSGARRGSLAALWLMALGLGAAHSLQPGHGKMLVAAGTTDHGRRWGPGVLLALTLTVTHSTSVLAVAGVVWLTRSNRYSAINEVLAHAAGFAIAAIGVWRLGRWLGRYDNAPEKIDTISTPQRSIIALGISGGLVPCWDAILLVLEAEFLGQFALGLLLLSAFSLGMAGVLVVVAFASARIRRLVHERDRLERWSHHITLVSALVLTGVGLYLLFS